VNKENNGEIMVETSSSITLIRKAALTSQRSQQDHEVFTVFTRLPGALSAGEIRKRVSLESSASAAATTFEQTSSLQRQKLGGPESLLQITHRGKPTRSNRAGNTDHG
jgi:hypothetical protein